MYCFFCIFAALNKNYKDMKKNLTYILKNLTKTFGIKFGLVTHSHLAFLYFDGNIDEEHLNSDMQIYCAKFAYTWSGLRNDGYKNYFVIYSF